MLEYNLLKQILSEQQKTNALLEQLITNTTVQPIENTKKEGDLHVTSKSIQPKSNGTIQRKRE